MICPLCQTPQPPGTVFCTTCGNALAAPRVPDAATASMPELETNDLPGSSGQVAAAPMEGLEVTSYAAAPDGLIAPMAELETSDPAGGPVPIAPLEGLDDGRWEDPDPPSGGHAGTQPAAPSAATCRYCRNVQTSGLFCERCGMRLSNVIAIHETAGEAPPIDEEETRLCRGCGSRVIAGTVCRNCGIEAPPAEP